MAEKEIKSSAEEKAVQALLDLHGFKLVRTDIDSVMVANTDDSPMTDLRLREFQREVAKIISAGLPYKAVAEPGIFRQFIGEEAIQANKKNYYIYIPRNNALINKDSI